MHFPDEIDTGHETVRGEEAFLIMLKRPAALSSVPEVTLGSATAQLLCLPSVRLAARRRVGHAAGRLAAWP